MLDLRSTPRFRKLHLLLVHLLALNSIGTAFSMESPGPGKSVDVVRVTVDPSAISIDQEPNKNKFALVIGVGHYSGGIYPLKKSTKDAVDFKDFLLQKWNFPSENITLMTDDKNPDGKSYVMQKDMVPDYSNIVDQVDGFMQKINKDSIVVVYFSGHGTRIDNEDYLVPADAKNSSDDVLKQTCFNSTKYIINKLKSIQPKRALLIFDACRDMSDEEKGVGKVVGFGMTDDKTPPSQAQLYSCKPNQVSYDLPDLPNAVFTNFLLKGLRDQDTAVIDRKVNPYGTVTFGSLLSYMITEMNGYFEKYNLDNGTDYQQTPDGDTDRNDLWIENFGELPIPPDLLQKKAEDLMFKDDIFIQQRNWVKVEADIKQAYQWDSENGRTNYEMGQLSLYYYKDPKNAIRYFQEAKRLDPTIDVDDEINEARKQIALAATPAIPVTDPTAQSRDLLREAQESLAKQDYSGADSKARAALGNLVDEKEIAIAHFILGRVWEEEKNYDNALREYIESLHHQMDLADAISGKDRVTKEQGEADLWDLSKQGDELLKVALLPNAVNKDSLLSHAADIGRQILASAPSSREIYVAHAHFFLAWDAKNQGRLPEALDECQQAKSLDPTLPTDSLIHEIQVAQDDQEQRARMEMARQAYDLAKAGSYTDAKEKADEVLAKDPSNAYAHFALGEYHESIREYPLALQEYQEAYGEQVSLTDAYDGQQRMLKAIPEADNARLMDQAQGLIDQNQFSQAEALARQAVAYEPENARAYLVLGTALLGDNRIEESIQTLKQAALLAPDSLPVRQTLESAQTLKNQADSKVLADRAYQHLFYQEYLAARDDAKQAVTLDPNNQRAHALAGISLLILGDKESGNAEIDAAKGEDTALYHIGLGLSAELQNDDANAEKEFQEAKRLDPQEIFACNNLAELYLDLGFERGEQLAQSMEESLRRHSKNQDPQLENTMQKEQDDRDRYFKMAEENILQLLALRPDYPTAHAQLGTVYLYEGQEGQLEKSNNDIDAAEAFEQKSADEFRAALKLYPDGPGLHAGLAGSLYLLGQISSKKKMNSDARQYHEDAVKEAQTARNLGLKHHWVYIKLRLTP